MTKNEKAFNLCRKVYFQNIIHTAKTRKPRRLFSLWLFSSLISHQPLSVQDLDVSRLSQLSHYSVLRLWFPRVMTRDEAGPGPPPLHTSHIISRPQVVVSIQRPGRERSPGSMNIGDHVMSSTKSVDTLDKMFCRTVEKSTKKLLIPLTGITAARSPTVIFRLSSSFRIRNKIIFSLTGRDEKMRPQPNRHRGVRHHQQDPQRLGQSGLWGVKIAEYYLPTCKSF